MSYTTIEVVSIVAIVFATIVGPVLSIYIGQRLQTRSDRARNKLFIYAQLMSTRHDPVTEEAVKALNLIDVVFHESTGVRDKWAVYYQYLSDGRLNNATGYAVREQAKAELLRAMAADIGISNLATVDFSRVYFPDSLYQDQMIRSHERQVRMSAVKAAQNPPPDQPQPPPEGKE